VLLAALALLFGVCGCNVLNQLVGDMTRQTVDISQTISDSSTTSQYSLAVIADNVTIGAGQAQTIGPESVSYLSDPIEISRLQLGQVAFFLTYDIRNLGNRAANVVVSISPNDPSQPEIGITTIAVGAQQSANVGLDQTLDSTTRAIDTQLKEALNQLDGNAVAYVHFAVEGGDGDGVLIEQLGIAAPPSYLHTQHISAGLPSAVKIDRVYDTQFLGAMTNNGAAAAEVRFYLRRSDLVDTPDDPVGMAEVQPGETVTADQMLATGGSDLIQRAFDEVAGGDDVYYYLTIVSPQTIQFMGDDLRIDAEVEYELHPFA
jgi:hypothetical protein